MHSGVKIIKLGDRKLDAGWVKFDYSIQIDTFACGKLGCLQANCLSSD